MRILVTRPAPDNALTAQKLRAMGHEPVLLPLTELAVTDEPLPARAEVTALALTSANAVRALAARGELADLMALPVFTVGDRTAEAARAAGFGRVESAAGTLDDLVALMTRHGVRGTVLYPAARQRAGELDGVGGVQGAIVATVAVYEMRAVREADAARLDPAPEAALFYSARAAALFCRLEGVDRFEGPCLCLSPRVAKVLQDAGYENIRVAPAPNEAALLALAEETALNPGGER